MDEKQTQDLDTPNGVKSPTTSSSSKSSLFTSFLSLIIASVARTYASFFTVLTISIAFSLIYYNSNNHYRSLSSLFGGFAQARVLDDNKNVQSSAFLITPQSVGYLNNSIQPIEGSNDKLLGGLLSAGFDEGSCLSRYQTYMYRKASPFKPSSYLLSRLRKYEDLHKRCGPGTGPYNEAMSQLRSFGNQTAAHKECNYVVWVVYSGLGNKILTIASAFLYALLTNRVLLVDPGSDVDDLFCEPFPSTSWYLPQDFPLSNQLARFNQNSPQCFGFMLKNNLLNSSSELVPPYLYLHLVHDYNEHDRQFFCDEGQSILAKVQWHILKTNNYFLPFFYLMPAFEQEMLRLFPDKEAIFHHLGRYLFHPTNQVWGYITRYYNAYLARADERIGVQIRTFGYKVHPNVVEQIETCLWQEKLVPEIIKNESSPQISKNPKSIAVLVTSLLVGYYENFKEMYWEHPTVTGDVVGFYQPSHEESQQTEKKNHDRKAWAEMYLLSLVDKLAITGWSTFGYTAQSLAGIRPWILYKSGRGEKINGPPCVRAMSMEPCFHSPPYWDCKAKKDTDTGNIVPHVRHCEDIGRGIKVVEGKEAP